MQRICCLWQNGYLDVEKGGSIIIIIMIIINIIIIMDINKEPFIMARAEYNTKT